MIRNHSQGRTRSAFTLVELMVVILIIAILVSLISSAVMKALDKIPEVQTRTEITQLEIALRAFMTDYGLADPPPSKLLLFENISLYALPANQTNPLAVQSYKFLQKVFGKNLGPAVDWNGDLAIDGPGGNATLPWVLEGEFCLTFYLGGIPGGAAGPQGFSTNNFIPSTPGGKRKGPYFTFVNSRLVLPPAVGGFYLYIDPWQKKTGPYYGLYGGAPYVFFSSNGLNNGYNYTDCAGLTFSDILLRPQIPLPYYTAVNALGVPTAYTSSNTYQIISAGKDGVFGYNLVPPSIVPPPPPGPPLISDNNIWVPASGAAGSGADDQASFSGSLLGAGQS